MPKTLTRDDQDLLLTLADCRVLTCEQLARLCERNIAATRRRLRTLKDQGFVKSIARAFGQGPGRPEGLVAISSQSVDALKEDGLIPESASPEQLTADRLTCVEHRLAINDTRIQLVTMSRAMPEFQVRFFLPMPLREQDGGTDQDLTGRRTDGDNGKIGIGTFTPDGVFVLTHQGARKTLLFFLEVDMNTQPLNSRSPLKRDIQRKIRSYKEYFRSQGYRRYEELSGCPLRGFRLLFLTTHAMRLSALCRLVRGMPPSGFIWLADRPNVAAHGIWASIWTAGGEDTQAPQSILGARMPNPYPSPAEALEARTSAGGGVMGWLSWMLSGRTRDHKGHSTLQ